MKKGHRRQLLKIKQVAWRPPCYLTFDIDALDAGFAPGTGTPVWGGLTSPPWRAINDAGLPASTLWGR